uniref:VWFA domain-containing protein n=1 Tax=Parastrongyloides trichosuri TaxID=131310 RepID=A0A0N5A6L1_PARTI
MKSFLCIFVLLYLSINTSALNDIEFSLLASTQSPSYGYGSKNCTSIEQGRAYLDIVVILDSSNGSQYQGFNGQKGNVISLISALTIGQGNAQVSRISVITAATNAKVVSDLNAYKSNSDAIRSIMGINFNDNTGPAIDVQKALAAADQVITSTGRGPNYKKVILMYSSAMEDDCTKTNSMASTDESPCRTASNIKNQGTSIITLALQYQDGVYNPPVNGIASPCFAIKASDFLVKFVELFTYVNCFCSQEFTQFFDTKTCYRAAECLYVENTPTGYTVAQQIAALANGTLVDIRSQLKQEFVMQIASASLPLFIGLNQIKNPKLWQWDTGYNITGYDHFYKDNEAVTGKCAAIYKNGYWYNNICSSYEGAMGYIYQVSACDAGNFCGGK